MITICAYHLWQLLEHAEAYLDTSQFKTLFEGKNYKISENDCSTCLEINK